jgi:hypothetical protein
MKDVDGDLNFRFAENKAGDMDIWHHGKLVTHFKAARAQKVLIQLEVKSFVQQQLLLARLTGNYKRGNEKLSKSGPDARRR